MPTPTKYESWQDYALDTGIVWGTDTIKCSLHTSTYVPAAATHDFYNDVTNEVSGTNYTAGGATMTTVSVSQSGGTATVDFDDITWTVHASGFSNARYAVWYEDTAGAATTDPLIAYADFTSDKGNTAGDLVLQVDAAGFFTQT